MSTISVLPQEILRLTSNYTIHSQYLLVCQYWLTCFRPSLYEQVNVNSRRQFRKLIRTIHQNKFLGLYVKHIIFDYKIGITRQELEDILPSCFPLLQTLDFNPKLWKYQRQVKYSNAQWRRMIKLPTLDRVRIALPLMKNHGHTLSHMSLSGQIVHELQASHQLMNVLQYTPHLTSLELYGKDTICNPITTSSYQSAEFTLLDILSIHKSLPKLEKLELVYVVLSIWPSTAELQLVPNNFMQKFSLIHSQIAHPQWLIAIANLYPNLKEIELNHVRWEETYKRNEMDTEFIKSCYAYLAKHCTRLEKVNLDCLAKSANQVFYQTLAAQNQSRLVSIKNNVDPTSTPPSDLKLLAHDILRCTDIQKTGCLQIQLWRNLQSIENIIQPISLACHRLQELELASSKFSFAWNYGCDLNVILKYCTEVVKLKLSTTRVTASRANKITSQHSKIKSIVLDRVHFSTEAINSISLLCPQLKRLEMLSCVKEKDAFGHKIQFNLSNLALDNLIFEKLYLRPSAFIEKSGIDAAIIAVKCNEKIARHDRRTLNSSITDENEIRWYYLYNQKASNKRNIRQLKRLNDEQSRQIKEYQMKEKDWDLIEEATFRGTYRDKKFWESDIPYGYLYISCQSVNTLVFNKVLI